MIEITFLGTGSMVPTKDRNVQSICIEYNGELILVDCGEGTQRQMNIAGLNRMKVKKVLISHWHGDHMSGLVGLIQTIGNGGLANEEKPVLHIYGPEGTRKYMNHLLKSCAFALNLNLKIHELNPKTLSKFFETDSYELWAAPMKHAIPCLGFAFAEKDRMNIVMQKAQKLGLKEGPELGKIKAGKSIVVDGKRIKPEDITIVTRGKKIAIITDTGLNEEAFRLAESADLLISESSFGSELDEKAEKYKHMTAKDAASVANRANVHELILTHFSQRYKTIEEVLDDAKKYFQNTRAAFDFMKIKL